MKRILVDECVDERLRNSFPDHDCQTVRYAGFAGLKNGELLDAAESAHFDVLLTVDRGFSHQQNLAGRKIALLILVAPSNRLADLEPLVPAALAALDAIEPGSVVRVEER